MDTTKQCKACQEVKPLAGFYVHKGMTDGHLNKCKECVKNRVKVHRYANHEQVLEYDRKRSKTTKRHQANIAKTIVWRQKYPEKYRAHNAVNNALRDGRLFKGACEDCGDADSKVEAHHTDYSKPLDVIWLCSLCHGIRHRQ